MRLALIGPLFSPFPEFSRRLAGLNHKRWRSSAGPGVEFLEYLAPRDGRGAPDDRRTNDLTHWQTKLVTDDIESSAARLRQGKHPFISSGVIRISEPALGFKQSLLVRAPDAHALQLIEK